MEDYELIIEYWNKNIESCTISKNGELSIKKLLLNFTKDEIIKAIDIAIANYIYYDDEVINYNSVELAFSKLGGICSCNNDEVLQKALYIRGILRNRFYIKDEYYHQIVDLIKETYRDGYTLDSIESSAKTYGDFYEWYIMMNERENDE